MNGCGKLWDDQLVPGSFVTECHWNNLCPECSQKTSKENKDE